MLKLLPVEIDDFIGETELSDEVDDDGLKGTVDSKITGVVKIKVGIQRIVMIHAPMQVMIQE